MAQNLLFLLVVFLSNVVQCVTGFAGTVLAMPFSVLLVGTETARPVLNAVAIAASVGVLLKTHRSVNKREFLKILAITLPGMIAGSVLRGFLATNGVLFMRLLGGLVVAFAVVNFIGFLRKKNIFGDGNAVGAGLLVLGGVAHGMFVCGGPLIVSYASVRLKDTNEFRSTLSAVWVVLNTLLLVSDAVSGSFTPDCIKLLGLSLVLLIFSIILGNKLAEKLSKNVFLVLTYVLMIISGAALLLK